MDGWMVMDSVAANNSADIAARETLLESITTEAGRENYVRSASAISTGTARSEARSVHGHKDCQYRVPKNTLTFLSQIIVVYGIISVSVYHLSVQSPNQELWLILLSSAFGYILPSPGLKYLKPSTPLTSVKPADPTLFNDVIDAAISEESKPPGHRD